MKLYIETSVPNFLFITDDLPRRALTERFFDEIRRGMHDAWVSGLYIQEVLQTKDTMRRIQLEGVVGAYDLRILPCDDRASALAMQYVQAGAFTANNMTDAMHVATAVTGECQVVVSWNFGHIVRAWTMRIVEKTNRSLGLPSVVICTPEEVIGRGE